MSVLSPEAAAGVAERAVQYALSKLGAPYCWGGTGPSCWDCSGLIFAAYRAAGVTIPRTTYTQLNSPAATRFDSKSGIQLGVGDLVFPIEIGMGHVGLYIGGNQVIHSPHTGTVVSIRPLWSSWTARRFVTPGTVGSDGTATNAAVADQVASGTAELRKVLAGLDIGKPNPAPHQNFWIRALLFVLGAFMLLEITLRVVRGSGVGKVAGAALKGAVA
jgi:hypothetical protein